MPGVHRASREALSHPSAWENGLYSFRRLDIRGYRGKAVQNILFKQDQRANHIALVFPGYGYRCYGPLMYYTHLVLLSLGADVMWVEYAYDMEPDYGKIKPS